MPHERNVGGDIVNRSLVTTDIERAVATVHAGGLVAIPTETVYGLAADASDPFAVQRIFDVKGRPRGHPLIVHLASIDEVSAWASEFNESARSLATAAWPGPLTIIVPRASTVLDEVTGALPTVGLRVPAHPLAHELLTRAGLALAAPSANRFGSVSPTTADHVLHDLGDRLDPDRDVILDGGASPIGVESTIVDCATDPPQILRAGGIPSEDIVSLLDGRIASADGPARASGMLTSHYAPRCTVKVVDTADDAFALRAGTPNSVILDLTDDLPRYAHDLYGELRAADRRGLDTVIAVLPPAAGLGHAIRDRLHKAAAPRPS